MTKFTAKIVGAFKEEYSEDFAVFNIFFEEFSPEEGGESWTFQRALGANGTISSLGEEDEGVCIVKEIQQSTQYEGIMEVEISKNRFVCKFNSEAVEETKTEILEIDYVINDQQWKKLSDMAALVFINKDYFVMK